MAATPQYATFVFRGMISAKTYIKDAYFSDVNSAMINWDAGAGANASSPQDWTPPEPVILQDAAIVTGTVDTTKLQLCRNGSPTGDFLRYAMHLTTLNNRPLLTISFLKGDRIQGIQKA